MREEKKLFTIKEVAMFIGISESEAIRLVMLKEITSVRLGRSIRIREEDLEVFFSSFSSNKVNKTKYFEPKLYSAEQVSKILQISIDNVWDLLKSNQIKGFKIRTGRSSWRIPAQALNEFIEKRTEENSLNA
jgi:excisionase family DNA binding protein